jgi:hypothetical protein
MRSSSYEGAYFAKSLRQMKRRLWPSATPRELHEAGYDMRGDAEVKAARALGVPPAAVTLVARSRFGRSLSKERDDRVAAKIGDDASPETEKAFRGRVTRDLIEELRPLVSRARRLR